MTAFLSPFVGALTQLFSNAGIVLAGGKIYFYLAGSTTPENTWTDSTQTTANANPVVLDSYGRTTQEIWLTSGTSYKIVVKDSAGVQVGQTWDNISGINDLNLSSLFAEWLPTGVTPSYVSSTQFSVPGDYRDVYQVNRRVRAAVSAGTVYSVISNVSYSVGITTVTVVNDSTVLDSGISSADVGILTPIGQAADSSSISYRQASTPSSGSSTAVLQRADALTTLLTTGGTGSAFTLTSGPKISAYATNYQFLVKLHAACSGTPTMNVNSLGVKNLKQLDSTGAKVTAVAPAGAIALMVYDGTDMVFMYPMSQSGRLLRVTKFTAGGTWTKGSDVGFIEVEGVGGGGGSVTVGLGVGGGGGGAGGYCRKIIAAGSLGATETVTIGAGGAGAANGGNTTFGAHFTASGGSQGNVTGVGGGGDGGAASGGDVNCPGGGGGYGGGWSANYYSGAGGNSYFGGGAAGAVNRAAAVNGDANTGGGASCGTAGDGTGGSGRVTVYEYS